MLERVNLEGKNYMEIVVLAGGFSPERDVSLSSGAMVANALIKNGHQVLLVDAYLGLTAVTDFKTAYKKYKQKNYRYEVPNTPPDLEKLRKQQSNDGAFLGPNVLAVCQSADMTFLALHGDMGENGQIQAAFDVHNITYSGTGYRGSLLAMDKVLAKQIMRLNEVKTANWFVANLNETSAQDFLPQVTFPCVIKPITGGSSIGVSLIDNLPDFISALKTAQEVGGEIMIEDLIVGREFSVGVLGDEALEVIEIIPTTGFYDYENKYQAGLTKEVCPAEISEALAKQLKEQALKVHRVLGLKDYSRIDFIVDPRGESYCLEANTLPGMTPTSLLPQEALAGGMSYEKLCQKIVDLSFTEN